MVLESSMVEFVCIEVAVFPVPVLYIYIYLCRMDTAFTVYIDAYRKVRRLYVFPLQMDMQSVYASLDFVRSA